MVCDRVKHVMIGYVWGVVGDVVVQRVGGRVGRQMMIAFFQFPPMIWLRWGRVGHFHRVGHFDRVRYFHLDVFLTNMLHIYLAFFCQ